MIKQKAESEASTHVLESCARPDYNSRFLFEVRPRLAVPGHCVAVGFCLPCLTAACLRLCRMMTNVVYVSVRPILCVVAPAASPMITDMRRRYFDGASARGHGRMGTQPLCGGVLGDGVRLYLCLLLFAVGYVRFLVFNWPMITTQVAFEAVRAVGCSLCVLALGGHTPSRSP